MGGDIFLLMEKGEKEKAEAFLRTICFKGHSDEICIVAPIFEDFTPGDCWITFRDYTTGDEDTIKDVIRISYAAYEFNRHWATAMACGIRDHFKIKNLAWESLEDENNRKYLPRIRPCRAAILIIEDVMKNNPGYTSHLFDMPEDDIVVYKKIQKLYEDRIKELFKGAKE